MKRSTCDKLCYRAKPMLNEIDRKKKISKKILNI